MQITSGEIKGRSEIKSSKFSIRLLALKEKMLRLLGSGHSFSLLDEIEAEEVRTAGDAEEGKASREK